MKAANVNGGDLREGSPCPECGAEMEHRQHRFSSDRGPNLPDCDWMECPECDYRTDPE